jgi:signal transduction histidine kinase
MGDYVAGNNPRKESQSRIQMQERLATVGQLAAGIAHDFNNIMAAILVYADLLRSDPNLQKASQDRLLIIQQQVQRAASLIRQILDFSRRSVMEQSSLDVLPFIKELEKMWERYSGNDPLELKYRRVVSGGMQIQPSCNMYS